MAASGAVELAWTEGDEGRSREEAGGSPQDIGKPTAAALHTVGSVRTSALTSVTPHYRKLGGLTTPEKPFTASTSS